MPVDDLERGDEPLAPLLVQGMDRAAQALDRLGQVVALGDQLVAAIEDLDELLVGAQVDGAEPLALLAQIVEPALDLDRARQGPVARVPGKRGEARGLAVEFGRNRVHKLVAAQARAFDALLRRRALLARRRHRFERLAGGAVGVGERGLAERERVGGLLARGFGLGEFVGERMGAAGEFGRSVGDRRPLPLRLGAPLGEFGDAGERAIAPLGPRRPLGGDGRAPGGAGLGLALEASAPRRALP